MPHSTLPTPPADIDRVIHIFESLTAHSVAELGTIYAPDALFVDPFNAVQGLDAVKQVFSHMFASLEHPHFVVTGKVVQADQCFLLWEFRFRFRSFRRQVDQVVPGTSHLRFDAQGRLWVTGFSEGAIACIDVANWKADIYPLPRYAPNEIPAPYALAINPVTQEVWVNDTMLDLAWRFLPKEQRFVAYPMPLKGTYTRDFSFTPDGWACTANNPIPAAALEGGTPELVCIDPGKPTNAVAVSAR